MTVRNYSVLNKIWQLSTTLGQEIIMVTSIVHLTRISLVTNEPQHVPLTVTVIQKCVRGRVY